MLSRSLRGTITDEWFPKMTFAMIAPYLTPSTGVSINRLPHSGGVHDGASHHSRAIRNEKNRGLRGVRSFAWSLQKVQARHPRDHLVLSNVHLARQNVHRLLNHAAICVRGCAKRYHPDTCGTKFKRQVFRKRFNRPECRANCRRAFNMTTRGTARDKKDHVGALLHHLARGSARGDELRLNERLRDDKLSDRQVDSVLAIAVFSRGRANSIKEDVDTAAFRDTVDVRVDRRVIKSVDNRCMRAPAGPHDLLLYLSDVRLGATGKINFSAFSRELFGDCPFDRTAGAEDNG